MIDLGGIPGNIPALKLSSKASANRVVSPDVLTKVALGSMKMAGSAMA